MNGFLTKIWRKNLWQNLMAKCFAAKHPTKSLTKFRRKENQWTNDKSHYTKTYCKWSLFMVGFHCNIFLNMLFTIKWIVLFWNDVVFCQMVIVPFKGKLAKEHFFKSIFHKIIKHFYLEEHKCEYSILSLRDATLWRTTTYMEECCIFLKYIYICIYIYM